MQAPLNDTARKRLGVGVAIFAALLAVVLFVAPFAGCTMPWDGDAFQTVAADGGTDGDAADSGEAADDAAAGSDGAAAEGDQAVEGDGDGAAPEADAATEVPVASDAGATDASGATGNGAGDASSQGGSGSAASGSAAAPSASGSSTSASTGGSASAQAPSASGSAKQQQTAPAASTITVTVTIDASNAHKVNAAYPSSMGSKQVAVNAGASVYDALKATGVAVGGNSTYVSSINGLAEKACGSGSGWMYKVDGVYPNYACGKYKLAGGESIVWVYTVTKGDVS